MSLLLQKNALVDYILATYLYNFHVCKNDDLRNLANVLDN